MQRTCEVCGRSLESKSPQAKVCGSKCRWQKNWRVRTGRNLHDYSDYSPQGVGCSYEIADKIVRLLLNDPHAIDRWKKLIQMEEI